MLSEVTNYPTEGLPEQDAFIDTVIIEDPGRGYEDATISDDIRPVVRNGRIEAIEIVEQIPYKSLPELKVLSDTGFGAVIRPIMSLKREDRRTDPTQSGIFKVVQCVGTVSTSAPTSTSDVSDSVVRESDTLTATTTTETVEQTTQTTETTQTTTQTDVSDTTTQSQTTTSTTTQTGTTSTPSQQTSGQSYTPPNNNNSGGSGSSGSGGGQSSGGGYGY